VIAPFKKIIEWRRLPDVGLAVGAQLTFFLPDEGDDGWYRLSMLTTSLDGAAMAAASFFELTCLAKDGFPLFQTAVQVVAAFDGQLTFGRHMPVSAAVSALTAFAPLPDTLLPAGARFTLISRSTDNVALNASSFVYEKMATQL